MCREKKVPHIWLLKRTLRILVHPHEETLLGMQTCFFYQKLYDICNSRIIEKVTLTYLTFLILFTQGYLNILIFSREIDIYVFYINTLKIFIYDIFKKWMNFILVWLSVSIYRMKRVIVYLVLHIAELINMYFL